MKYLVTIGDRLFTVEITESDGKVAISLDGRAVSMDPVELKPSGVFSVIVGNKSKEAEVEWNSGSTLVRLDGRLFECRLEDERFARLGDPAFARRSSLKAKEIKAPMPGLVLAVHIGDGERVKPGQGLVTIEAMKMENEIRAAFEGTVKSVCVRPGRPVEKNEVMIVFE